MDLMALTECINPLCVCFHWILTDKHLESQFATGPSEWLDKEMVRRVCLRLICEAALALHTYKYIYIYILQYICRYIYTFGPQNHKNWWFQALNIICTYIYNIHTSAVVWFPSSSTPALRPQRALWPSFLLVQSLSVDGVAKLWDLKFHATFTFLVSRLSWRFFKGEKFLICCHWQGMNSIDFLTGRKCSFYWLTSCLSLRFTTSCWKVPFHKDRSYYNQSRVPDEKTANGLVSPGVACLTPINLNICSSFIKIVSMAFRSTQQIQFQSCSLGVSNSRGVNRVVPSFQTCARWEICYKDRTHRGAGVFADPIWKDCS